MAIGDTCERCDERIRLPGRFNLRAYDYADSTGAYIEGRLCTGCWDRFIRFLEGEPLPGERQAPRGVPR